MTLIITPAELRERQRIAAGALRPLADSLAADLDAVLARPLGIPAEKARLTRLGGRCPNDGAPLDYDPWSARAHRCPRCGTVFTDDAHYRYWLMWHQLWIAERAVHGAALYALRGEDRHRDLALRILSDYAGRYLAYPNRDNVLGPSRVFFSTYLESIWLLELCVAIDLLEMAGVHSPTLGTARDRIVAPSTALIASYDEGTSNRQAWNTAALLASAAVLGDRGGAERAVHGPHGLRFLLERALLPDGSWYEGENYHVFAHRGLWYGVTAAARLAIPLDDGLVDRFDRGFAIPFLTALPDMTMLARRDSQYAISLRQWRFAELCELGLARSDDPRLRAALGTLYDSTEPRRETGRARSSAEAERHSPPSVLSRADLGWRSLLHARETLPPLGSDAPRSVLLENQGLAVFRRDEGRLFAAMDYGESGGGHGHPDRLELVVCDGDNRWLDDPGTGSYVDRSLHWYRSTLAHSAPLAGRTSQPRMRGELLAFDERGAAGWVAARAILARDAAAERRLVTMPDYVVDELSWATSATNPISLPIHLDLAIEDLDWHRETLGSGGGLEDGFDFVSDAEVVTPGEWPLRAVATEPDTGAQADVWITAPNGSRLWRLVAPAPPLRPAAMPTRPEDSVSVKTGAAASRTLVMLESSLARGTFTTVIAPRRTIRSLEFRDASIIVEHADGSVHEHAGDERSWRIAFRTGKATSSIELRGAVAPRPAERTGSVTPSSAERPLLTVDRRHALSFALGEREYRRSEESWVEAGEPRATVAVAVEDDKLAIEVDVRAGHVVVIADDAVNEMDNEHPDVNAAGVQLSIVDARRQLHRWLVRPGIDGAPRVRPLTPGAPSIGVSIAMRDTSWSARIALPLGALGDASPYFIALGITINEIPPERERRRGQLVLGGAGGEWVYLRGDRDDPSKLIPIVVHR